MIRAAAIAALLAIVGASGCGPPAQVFDRVPEPVRPAWIASQPEASGLDAQQHAAIDRDLDRYGDAMLQVRSHRLSALALAVREFDPRSVDPEALRRWIAEARATRADLDAADASLFGELAAGGVIGAPTAQRWSLRRRVERELDLLAQAGFGSPPDGVDAILDVPPPGWTPEQCEAWADGYRGWLVPKLAALNDALLQRPLERRLAPSVEPRPDGSPAPDPIDESFKERLRALSAECTARTLQASDDDAWRTAMGERLKGVVSSPPVPKGPGGARYPDDAGPVAIFLPAAPTDAEWVALARAAGVERDALSPLRSTWEASWTAGVAPIAARALGEVELAQAAADGAGTGSPREVAQRLHAALDSAIREVQQVESDADDALFAGLGERGSSEVIGWWRSMRAAPPRPSDAPGAGLGRAFGMGACRRDRALVELAALSVATDAQRDAVLRALADGAADRIALARELDRSRLAAWKAVFESIVTMQRDPLALNPTLPRAALASSADMSGRFIAAQDAVLSACSTSVPGIESPLRERVRALAWPEFFADAGPDPVAQQTLIAVRGLLPAGFDASPLDAAIERELQRIDLQAGRTPWLPGMPLADPEGDWPAILRRDPALFRAVWARTVMTDRAVRDAALDPSRPDRGSLLRWLRDAARPAGRRPSS
ncbi:MAG: hypothetical protein RLZZ246_696 [Planctomycetota bacterium]